MELGVNYKATEARWATDIAYFKAIGVTCIRIHMAALPTPWNSGGNSATPGTYAYWRRMADTMRRAGFWVTWGPSGLNGITGGTMTATNWIQYHDTVVAEAAYLQSQGIVLDCFELGNEMESQADGTTLTVDQMQINLGTLANDVRAVYPLAVTIGYSPWDFAGTTFDKWIANGKGGLDVVNVHPYSNVASNGHGLSYGNYPACMKMIKFFGPDHCYVTEFGLEGSSDANFQIVAAHVDLSVASLRDRWRFLKAIGFKKAMLYTWCGYLNGDDQFAMQKMADFSVHPMWSVIANDAKRQSDYTKP